MLEPHRVNGQMSLTRQRTVRIFLSIMKRAILFSADAQCSWLVLVLVLIGAAALAQGQSKVIYLGPAPNPQSKGTNPQPKPMTVEDVVKLSKAGLSDDLIIQQIKKKGQPFDLSTDQLLQLKTAHVSDRVIKAMTEARGADPNASGDIGMTTPNKNITPTTSQAD